MIYFKRSTNAFFEELWWKCQSECCSMKNYQLPTSTFQLFHCNRRAQPFIHSTLESATMAAANGKAKEFYEDEKNLNKLCNFLRSAEGPAVREAVMMDKRVYYIKGKEMLC